jgi:hypothetical protein
LTVFPAFITLFVASPASVLLPSIVFFYVLTALHSRVHPPVFGHEKSPDFGLAGALVVVGLFFFFFEWKCVLNEHH